MIIFALLFQVKISLPFDSNKLFTLKIRNSLHMDIEMMVLYDHDRRIHIYTLITILLNLTRNRDVDHFDDDACDDEAMMVSNSLDSPPGRTCHNYQQTTGLSTTLFLFSIAYSTLRAIPLYTSSLVLTRSTYIILNMRAALVQCNYRN